MYLNDTFKVATINLGELTTGSIGLASETVDIASQFIIEQTIPNQVFTIPFPSCPIIGDRVRIINGGVEDFKMSDITVKTDTTLDFTWIGESWAVENPNVTNITNIYNGDATTGAIVTYTGIVLGVNLIPHNLALTVGNYSAFQLMATGSCGEEYMFRRVVSQDTENSFAVTSPVAIETAVTFYVTPFIPTYITANSTSTNTTENITTSFSEM